MSLKERKFPLFSSLKASEGEKVSAFLVFYRWANWLLALILLILGAAPKIPSTRAWSLIVFVCLYNTILGRYHPYIYKKIKKQPFLLGIDYLICFSLVALSGGWRSPYYLYSFSPLLIAALVGKVKGGLIGAPISAILNLSALALNGFVPQKLIEIGFGDDLIADQLSYFLIGIFFTYPAILMERLDENRAVLEKTRRDLESRVEILRSIYSMAMTFTSKHSLQEVMAEVVTSVKRATKAKEAGLCLFVEGTNELCLDLSTLTTGDISVSHPKRVSESKREWRDHMTPLRSKILNNMEKYVEDVNYCPRLLKKKKKEEEWLTCFPLKIQDEKIGVLTVVAPRPFDNKDEVAMGILTSLGTIAIKNARLVEERQKLILVDERNRIAGEMHDGVVQSLFGVNVGLETCRNLLSEKPEEAIKMVEDLEGEVSLALQELRNYIFDLQKNHLAESVGLTKALKMYVNQFDEFYEIPIKFISEGIERDLSNDVQKKLCHIMREALSNLVKYAEASCAEVKLVYEEGVVKLTVYDDGKGFDVRKAYLEAEEKGSLGLFGMKDKAESLGGSLSIISDINTGTRVEAIIPSGEN